jgi:serine/threonine protein kinase
MAYSCFIILLILQLHKAPRGGRRMGAQVGQQIGHYRLLRLLGEGGFAQVYLGEHQYLHSQVAIKFLHTRLSQPEYHGFLVEAQLIARLKHPQIVRVLDFGLEEGVPYLVMDYAPQGTVRQCHPRGTRLPLATITPYVQQVAAALAHAHAQGIIHRDVKPENLLIGSQGELLLSDFGIATLAHCSSSQRTGELTGTIAYMAPEQAQGKPHVSSDQYALGVVVYEWLTGDCPFHGTALEILSQHVLTAPPPLRQKVPGLPAAIEEVVLTALAKEYHQRFPSIEAFAQALTHAVQQADPSTSVPAVSVSAPPPTGTATEASDSRESHAPVPPATAKTPSAELPLQALALPEIDAKARMGIKALGVRPTDAQWHMVLSPSPALSVIAGAGSGKSTALVWRLLVLHKVLHIPLEKIHVFSFTRASTRDFRQKLVDALLRWEAIHDKRASTPQRRRALEGEVEKRVSTFHQVIASFKKDLLPGAYRDYFDVLNERPATEETIAGCNPFLLTKLTEPQLRLLNQAHTEAYRHSERYQALVDALAEMEEQKYWKRVAESRALPPEEDPAIWYGFLAVERRYHGFDSYGEFAPPVGSQDSVGTWHADPIERQWLIDCSSSSRTLPG